ncbi:hypothetical protein SDC9_104144 [bioreactor metagenome]|uniref:Spo0E like sporulation regulatory protein n=1 Tax=bioreactor metagenome TaxID=1076179 RepID=A0A645AVP9_9ZZZZ
MWDLLRQMEETIEMLRGQMHNAADQKGRVSEEVLSLSQELDRLLNVYERLKILPKF